MSGLNTLVRHTKQMYEYMKLWFSKTMKNFYPGSITTTIAYHYKQPTSVYSGTRKDPAAYPEMIKLSSYSITVVSHSQPKT